MIYFHSRKKFTMSIEVTPLVILMHKNKNKIFGSKNKILVEKEIREQLYLIRKNILLLLTGSF